MHWAFQWCKFHDKQLPITMEKSDPCSEATKICRLNLYPHTVLTDLLSGFLQIMLGCASVKVEDLIKRTDMLLLNRCS